MFSSVITKNSNWEILTKNLVIQGKIGLRIKNLILLGVTKNQYGEELAKKGGGLESLQIQEGGGLGKKEGVGIFEGGRLIPQCPL